MRRQNKVYLANLIPRTHLLGNIEIFYGAILTLPRIVTVAGTRIPSLNVYGSCLGIQKLRLFKGSAVYLQSSGQTSCTTCFFAASNRTEFPGKYYFQTVELMKSSYIVINSYSTNVVSNSIHLYADVIDVENTAFVRADVVQIVSLKTKVELDAKLSLVGGGHYSGQGSGRPPSHYFSGAGHAGKGGVGYQTCDQCYSGKSDFMIFLISCPSYFM